MLPENFKMLHSFVQTAVAGIATAPDEEERRLLLREFAIFTVHFTESALGLPLKDGVSREDAADVFAEQYWPQVQRLAELGNVLRAIQEEPVTEKKRRSPEWPTIIH